MTPEPRDNEREFRLEGMGLAVLGAFFIAALAGAFFLGRWVERGTQPAMTVEDQIAADPLQHVISAEEADVDADTNYFDEALGGAGALEPERQARAGLGTDSAEVSAPVTPPKAKPIEEPKKKTPPPPVQKPDKQSGSFYVQVFAGRDRGAAEKLVSRLKGEGAMVRLFTESEGRDSLFKVRVGGFPSQDAARLVAQDLQKKGYAGAWVTLIE